MFSQIFSQRFKLVFSDFLEDLPELPEVVLEAGACDAEEELFPEFVGVAGFAGVDGAAGVAGFCSSVGGVAGVSVVVPPVEEP